MYIEGCHTHAMPCHVMMKHGRRCRHMLRDSAELKPSQWQLQCAHSQTAAMYHAFQARSLTLSYKRVLQMEAYPRAALYLTPATVHRVRMPFAALLQAQPTEPHSKIMVRVTPGKQVSDVTVACPKCHPWPCCSMYAPSPQSDHVCLQLAPFLSSLRGPFLRY